MVYNPDELEQYNDAWGDAPDDDGKGDFGPVAPGTYQVRIKEAKIEDSDYDGHPQLALTLQIMGGDFNNRLLWVNNSFNPSPTVPTKGGKKVAPIVFLKKTVNRLALDPPIAGPAEIATRLDDMLDRIIEVNVQRNPKNEKYPKVYVNRYVGQWDESMGIQAADVSGDDIPF